MRIQHNIMAMNSYRNYNQNASALSKNLEKLSSGYRINRAGDDAAGLAISEKMRGQITGLEAAQKNVKDGVSLVKTAEGAMQEIHDMLGRMKYLATQSANGTYDNEVDRANIQKEVKSLKDEINRIADSANFNGQKLLDGSLSSAGGVGGTGHIDVSKLGVDITANAKDVAAVKGKWTIAKGAKSYTLDKDHTIEFTLHYTDEKGANISKTVSISQGNDTDGKTLYATIDGNTKKLAATATSGGKITSAVLGTVLKDALNTDNDIKNAFDITEAAGVVTLEARKGGTDGAKLIGADVAIRDTTGATTQYKDKITIAQTAEAKNAMKAYDFSKAKVWNNTGKGTGNMVTDDLKDAIFEINGKKFVFVQGSLTDKQKAEMKEAGVEHWVSSTGNAVGKTAIKSLVDAIGKETGLKVTQGSWAANTNGNTFTKNTTGTYVTFEPLDGSVTGQGGLKLQIGDTSDEYNQMTVGVNDMHTAALGIADVDLGSQEGAAAAVSKITDAINAVSSTRGDLGAVQNRLEHTEKNLSVMQENIQQAESNIRDTDVAAEMMQYTKNNILLQSAQAMLAQANQVPQGVLQLLQ